MVIESRDLEVKYQISKYIHQIVRVYLSDASPRHVFEYVFVQLYASLQIRPQRCHGQLVADGDVPHVTDACRQFVLFGIPAGSLRCSMMSGFFLENGLSLWWLQS